METYHGLGIGNGVCIGQARVVLPKTYQKEDGESAATQSLQGRWAAFEAARARAAEALDALAKGSRQSLGHEQAEIFEVQSMMLGDGGRWSREGTSRRRPVGLLHRWLRSLRA